MIVMNFQLRWCDFKVFPPNSATDGRFSAPQSWWLPLYGSGLNLRSWEILLVLFQNPSQKAGSFVEFWFLLVGGVQDEN